MQVKIKDVCQTRWIERVNGMDKFEEPFILIIYCLEKNLIILEMLNV